MTSYQQPILKADGKRIAKLTSPAHHKRTYGTGLGGCIPLAPLSLTFPNQKRAWK